MTDQAKTTAELDVIYGAASERKTSEEVNTVGHVQQRDTRTIDRIIRVTCWEA